MNDPAKHPGEKPFKSGLRCPCGKTQTWAKSTLVNCRGIGQKIAIDESPWRRTTRRPHARGGGTRLDSQLVIIEHAGSPQAQGRPRKEINQDALGELADADVRWPSSWDATMAGGHG